MAKKEVEESKIRIAIWELKKGKTKKHICQTLGITYNTKRLTKIIEDFKTKQIRVVTLKEKAKNSLIADFTKKDIISRYIEGEAIANIAEGLYLSTPRVKKLLIDSNIPLRGRGNKTPAKVEHVTQNLDTKFNKEDKVFIPSKNTYGIVCEIYDEEYIDNLSDGYSKAITIRNTKNEPRLGVHYEEYWVNKGIETGWKTHALQAHLSSIEQIIIETGREFYKVWVDNMGFYSIKRRDLFPVVIV